MFWRMATCDGQQNDDRCNCHDGILFHTSLLPFLPFADLLNLDWFRRAQRAQPIHIREMKTPAEVGLYPSTPGETVSMVEAVVCYCGPSGREGSGPPPSGRGRKSGPGPPAGGRFSNGPPRWPGPPRGRIMCCISSNF